MRVPNPLQQYLITPNLITISRERLLANLDIFNEQTKQLIIPVLKSNAYGHGIVEVAKILDNSPYHFVAVDNYHEAAQIIKNSKRIRVLVMGVILPNNYQLFNTRRISFVVQNLENLKSFAALRRRINIHLEINSGMNRLGLRIDELSKYLEYLVKCPRLNLEGVMTHLADADNISNTFTNEQIAKFDQMVEQIYGYGFNPKVVHVAQTAGSVKAKSRFANAVRIGIGTYGINPLKETDPEFTKLEKLQPILELTSTIVSVIDLQPGDSVGYNRTYQAKKATRVAILPLGYYEALPRVLSNQVTLTSGNWRLPVVGRICMNYTVVDITDTNLNIGDQVTVISRNITDPNSVANLEKLHGIFPYELLCKISPTIRRQIN
ncbi:alanine racemase [Candidatus Saccharibacteria bacterium]|nr:alanine racemase [Candidatus Saccharibacteria bacterium]